jgi:predicted nucleotide-binding protein
LESSQLPGLRPTRSAVQSIVDLVATSAGARIKRAADLLATADTKAERMWWSGYDKRWKTFKNTLDHSDVVDSVLSSITRSGRTRTNDRSEGHDPGNFDVLSEADVEAATVTVSSYEAGISWITVEFTPWSTSISIEYGHPDERLGGTLSLLKVEEVLQANAEVWQQSLQSLEPPPFRVFMGHGGDAQWRDLRDALRDHHGFDVEAFERVTRVGQTISEIVRSMIFSSTVGVLVLTRSDKQDDGTWHGRQNVIHELGFVQGALGWDRAVIVVEEGVVLPSNLDGTQQVRFTEGRIREAEGEVAAHLRQMRERPVGICP